MLQHRSMAFKLSLLILSLSGLIFAAAFSYNYYVSRKLLLRSTRANVEALSSATVGKIDSILGAAAKIPENLASSLESTEYTEAELEKLLRSTVEKNPEIYGSCIGFEPNSFRKDLEYYAPYAWRENGNVRFNNIGSKKYQYFYWDWYQIPRHLGRPMWTEPYFDEGGGNIIMSTCSVPFYRTVDGKRLFRGIVTVDISLSWLQKMVSSIKLYDTGFAYVISRNGTMVTHPVPKYIMNESLFSLAEENGDPRLRNIGRKMIRGESGFISGVKNLQGRKSAVHYSPIPSNGWSLGVEIPEDELFADLSRLFKTLAAIASAGILLLSIAVVVAVKRATRPLGVLANAAGKIGAGDFHASLPSVAGHDEIGRLAKSFTLMQEQLREYVRNLAETTASKEKVESELRIAHDIQMSIIPKIFPPFPDRDEFDLYAVLNPARSVGGDLYDFFLTDDKSLCVAVGDVSGKGVPASLFMAITRTLLRTKAQNIRTSAGIADSINADLCRDNEMAMFVTFFIAFVDIQTGKLEYTNAGHNKPYIIRRSGAVETLQHTHGTPLGISDEKYGADSIILAPGDKLVLYTDGVTEAVNTKDELFGEERLEKFLARKHAASVKDVVGSLVGELLIYSNGAEQADDITALVLEFFGTRNG